MTLADILIDLLIVALVSGVICAAIIVLGRAVERKRARQVEPDNCGDQGGMSIPVELRQAVTRPKAPETGSGLLAGAEAHKPWKARDMDPKDGD